MYIPEYFKENNKQCLYKAIKEIQVAHLITQHTIGIEATFLPLYLDEFQGKQGTLYGHISKANPQWKEPLINSEALIIYTGPYHYITPSWYPAKQTHHKVVPTLNYITLHVSGTIEFIQDTKELLSIVTELTNMNESKLKSAWKVEDAPPDYIQTMLKAIIGVKITINNIEGKYKLSQNHDYNTQQHIIHALQEVDQNTNNIEIASLMQNNLNKEK